MELPNYIKISRITLTGATNNGYSSSPFTGAGEPTGGGLELWRFTADLVPIRDIVEARAAHAFFLGLQGARNTFTLRIPEFSTLNTPITDVLPDGHRQGAPTLSVNHAARTSQLTTTGWEANQAYAVRAGSYLGVDGSPQVFKALEDVHVDGSGNATFSIFPMLRTSPTAGTRLKLLPEEITGTFRMVGTVPEFEVNAASFRPYRFRLNGVEDVVFD